MLARTHLMLGVLASLIFLPYIENSFLFLSVTILSSLLPDIDSIHSLIGRIKILRPVQWVVKHRGMIHSFTICTLLAIFFSLFFPLIVFPFFLGYGLHLLADSITVEGIRPFWPLRSSIQGKIRVGRNFEKIFFYFILIIILFLSLRLFFLPT